MTQAEWRAFFTQNRRDRRPVPWREPVLLDGDLAASLCRSVARLLWRQVRALDGLRRHHPPGALLELAREECEDARLWMRVWMRLGPNVPGMARDVFHGGNTDTGKHDSEQVPHGRMTRTNSGWNTQVSLPSSERMDEPADDRIWDNHLGNASPPVGAFDGADGTGVKENRQPAMTVSSIQLLVSDLVELRLCGLMNRLETDAALRTACRQFLHDSQFHARCLCEHWHQKLSTMSPMGRVSRGAMMLVFFSLGLFQAVWDHIGLVCRLGESATDFVRGCVMNFTTAWHCVWRGEPFRLYGCDLNLALTAGTRTTPRVPVPRRRPSTPENLAVAPRLDPAGDAGPVAPRQALLINPFYPKDPHASFGKHVLTPTLALTSIAAATPLDWTVRYWDENLVQGPPPVSPMPAVVGITVHLTFADRAFELARWYRQRGAKVVLGGLHVMSCPQECAAHADSIAMGDGVQLWTEILCDAAAGCLKPLYRADYRRAYRLDPPARRDLVPRASFLTTGSVIATRGCHNRCGFCYLSTNGYFMPYQVRDVEQLVDEMRASRERYWVFTDNNLGSRRDYLRALCRALEPLRIIWSAAVSVDVTDDAALVRAMARSGCTGVFVGLESLTGANLRDAGKKTPMPEEYAHRVRIFHEHGIQVNGSFVFGFDHDRPDVFERTMSWIEEVRMESATFHILTPYPGTPLFRQMEEENRLLHRDWRLYDTAHAVFRPRCMTPEELEDGYAWCYERLSSWSSVWRRRPPDASLIPSYLAMTVLYKRSNPLWHWLIRHRLTHAAWAPMVAASRWRHLWYRRRFATDDRRVVRL